MEKFYNNIHITKNGIKLSLTMPFDYYEMGHVKTINMFIDPNPGISYQDIYNVTSNHLFHEIKRQKWMIYDIPVNGEPVTYISYMENKIDMKDLYEGKYWPQIPHEHQSFFLQNGINLFLVVI